MSGRGTQNAPNTHNPKRPAKLPARLDQFADDLAEQEAEFGMDFTVTNRDDAKAQQKQSPNNK